MRTTSSNRDIVRENVAAVPRPHGPPVTADDTYYFREGTHSRLYQVMGAHLVAGHNVAGASASGLSGAHFAVWAPNAERVSVVGDFNDWQSGVHPLVGSESGIWEGFVEGASHGARYKYRIRSRYGGETMDKADPFAFYAEPPPDTASRIWSLDYDWGDREWMSARKHANALDAPWSIYEVHLGSWLRQADETGRRQPMGFAELAEPLADYVRKMGFTHVEFLPLTEHPFYGSWGYQTVGYFAPTARFGTPQDLKQLIDHLHQRGIGVIMDWVPSHFPGDAHGLARFDGTFLFEHQDPRQGYHPEWHSYLFNYGRNEVRAFLLSSAEYWLDQFHVDALRVDAVASMLYLDYGRKEGEWIPNRYGGRENLEAMEFLRTLNESVYREHPDVQTIAEESTAWPMVSRPTEVGGLGFGMKWNMGWMHDTLRYFSRDPLYRKYHHNELTFSLFYAFTENFLLPLSHDEVVYGKGSLLRKMPGDEWQRFANLRALFGYMYTHPGKKLLFMGGEFGQWNEWNHEEQLSWHLTEQPLHHGVQRWLEDLHAVYRKAPALWERDFSWQGFEWVDCTDSEDSVLSYLRLGRDGRRPVLVVINFTPVVRSGYRLGVPQPGYWKELLNSDATEYGGSGRGNFGGVESSPVPAHGRYHSLTLELPPLGVLVMTSPDADAGEEAGEGPADDR